jgi:hypothetical protein
MRYILIIALFFTALYAQEGISPAQFKVELIKRCEVLGLSKEPNRKAAKIYSHAHTGSCVQNLGCMREITQKQLDNEHNETKRIFMAWKYPVWCKVDSDGKRGWVRKQFLADKPCGEND